MTDINHRRKNKKPVNQRYAQSDYSNGYADSNNKNGLEEKEQIIAKLRAQGCTNEIHTSYTGGGGVMRVGRTDYLDKSMHGWLRKSELADKTIGARIGNDFTDGHKGMAKAVKGAKKYVRTRVRFHENAATRKMADNLE